MTTRDEARTKCIAAMAEAMFDCCCRGYNAETQKMLWGREAGDLKRKATAAFNALHGLAFVDPLEPTKEMIEAGAAGMYGKGWNGPEEEMPGEKMKNVWRRYAVDAYAPMATAGDLTNPPEKM